MKLYWGENDLTVTQLSKFFLLTYWGSRIVKAVLCQCTITAMCVATFQSDLFTTPAIDWDCSGDLSDLHQRKGDMMMKNVPHVLAWRLRLFFFEHLISLSLAGALLGIWPSRKWNTLDIHLSQRPEQLSWNLFFSSAPPEPLQSLTAKVHNHTLPGARACIPSISSFVWLLFWHGPGVWFIVIISTMLFIVFI